MREIYFTRISNLPNPLEFIEISLEADNFRTICRIRWNFGENREICIENKEIIDSPVYYQSYILYTLNKYQSSDHTPQIYEDQVIDMLDEYLSYNGAIFTSSTDLAYDKWVERYTAQSGIDTPGCTCNHENMGASWHGSECDWIKNANN